MLRHYFKLAGALTLLMCLSFFALATYAADWNFRVVTEKKSVRFPGEPAEFATHFTDVRMALRTESVATLEDYAVVQWIRGCQFETTWDSSGRPQKLLSISRYHFGKVIPFKHRTWEIDSDIMDPVYSSDDRFGRFALWRWNKDANSLEPRTATYYFKAPPPHPSIFLTDLPGGASYYKSQTSGIESAKNSSLEFKACLYRTKDIPEVSDPKGSNFESAEPLICENWEHKFVFDRTSKTFKSGGSIDPFCF